MYRLIRSILFLLDAELAHRLVMFGLKCWPQFWLRRRYHALNKRRSPLTVMGLQFPSRLGLAAGFDKNAACIDPLLALGFGFVEVGTVTPKPQAGNPKPRLFRIKKAQALINRMGFNNDGLPQFLNNVQRHRLPGIVGVNIGKNAVTPIENAEADYLECFEKVYLHASYIVINISSPNTLKLRELQHGEYSHKLLTALTDKRQQLANQYGQRVPLLVKLDYDTEPAVLDPLIKLMLKLKIEGVVMTNTSVDHTAVEGLAHAKERGGLSGPPLLTKACAVISHINKLAHGNLTIIGVGGISSVSDAQRMLDAGASLIQIYTAFIYQGPKLVSQINNLI